MIIRPLDFSDISTCASIMARNPLWQRYDITLELAHTRLESGFNNGASILVAEHDGINSGFIWFVEKGAFSRSGYIMLIAIDPDLHHLGIGQALMLQAEKILFKNSNDIFLLVSDFNTSAQGFYKRNGYAQIGSIPNYVVKGITELIFRKIKPSP